MGHFTDLILLVVGGGFALVALAKLGAIVGGKQAPWLGVVLVLLGLGSTPLLLGWLLDHFGVVERAVVADRRESVSLRINGAWRPEYWVTVKYPSAPAQLHRLRADVASYDRLGFGDPVGVRSLPIRRSTARLEMTSSAQWLRAYPRFGQAIIALGVVAVIVGLVIFGGKGARGTVRKLIGVSLVGLGGFSVYQDLKPYQGGPTPTPPTSRASGTVKRITRVSSLYPASGSAERAWRLAKPYRVVTAEFTPAGARGGMLAVDAVDEESIPNLAVGDQIAVQYSTGSPRSARLAAGTRTFPIANAGDTRIATGIGLGVLAVLVAFRAMVSKRR